MSTRRIVVVSPDPVFGQEIATALAPVDTAVEVQTPDSIDIGEPPALFVVHFDGELASGDRARLLRTIGDSPVIAVAPRSSLATVIELLQSSNSISSVLVAEQLDGRRLAAMATRIVTDDVFGLGKLMDPDTQIQTIEVGHYQQKVACMSRVSAAVESSGVPRKYHAPIEQCLDEMLMNALYDAPVDEQGARLFAGIPTRTRISMRSEQSVVVQFAFDGKRFGISVRDAFGSLERHTVVGYLHKCLHAHDQIDRKAGGAGVGMFLMVNSANLVHYNVLPGIATEAICVFDVETPKLQLEQFGFFVQNDAGGRTATGPSRRLFVSVRRSRIILGAVVAALAAMTVVGILAWPHLRGGTRTEQVTFTTIPRGATIDIDGRTVGVATTGTLPTPMEVGRTHIVVARLEGYEPARAVVTPGDGVSAVTLELQAFSSVELDSEPSGAFIQIDGKPMGSTPLTVTSLAPGSKVAVVFARPGHRSETAKLDVPARGKRTRLVQKLELSDEFVRIRFVSNPPGAEILVSGQPSTADRTYTPAELFVPVDTAQRFTLTMPNHSPLVIEPFTPHRGELGLEKGGDLIELPPSP